MVSLLTYIVDVAELLINIANLPYMYNNDTASNIKCIAIAAG